MEETATQHWDEILDSVNIYWQNFLQYLPRLAFAVIVLVITLMIATKIANIARRKLARKAKDPLFGRFVTTLFKYLLMGCCFILFLHILGLTGIAGSLLAGAGLSAIIFGFAFKDIAENFLAGIILAFDRPFRLNDTVRIGEETGHVMALNFRTTHLKTFDEKDVFIPNGKIIKDTLVNLTKDGFIRLDFLIGIGYENDINGALKLITKTCAEVEGVFSEREPFAAVEELAPSTVNIRLFFWSRTDDYKKGVVITKGSVIKTVKEALLANGFSLPADIKELKLYDKAPPIQLSVHNQGIQGRED